MTTKAPPRAERCGHPGCPAPGCFGFRRREAGAAPVHFCFAHRADGERHLAGVPLESGPGRHGAADQGRLL